jgi:hypothetical protein
MLSLCPSLQLWKTWTNIYVSTNIVSPEFIPSVCVYPLHPLLLGNSSINAFPRHQNIVGCFGFCAACVVWKGSRRLVLTEPLVTAMLLLYHFIIICAASWPYLGLILFQTSLLHLSCRQCCGTTESHCTFHSIWIAVASKLQLSTAVAYSSLYPPHKATEHVLFNFANKKSHYWC